MPRVSIMMPVYNAAATLRMALASVLAQSYQDWECVVVDDGSLDGSADVVASVSEPRFRLLKFPSNRGRPLARRAALEASGGEYVCMLDADDWMYPSRLEAQVNLLDARPEVAVVSAGMAIVSRDGSMVGARCFARAADTPPSAPVSPPNLLPIAHAASMLRREAIGEIRHDPRLKLSQDVDFLLRVLVGRRYLMMPDLLYAYTEHESVTGLKILRGHHYTRVIQRKYLRQHPWPAGRNILESYAKSAVYAGLTALGLDRLAISARSARPTEEQRDRFRTALVEVERIKCSVFA